MKTEKLVYEKPRIIELGGVGDLTKYYATGANSDGSSDHPRAYWN